MFEYVLHFLHFRRFYLPPLLFLSGDEGLTINCVTLFSPREIFPSVDVACKCQKTHRPEWSVTTSRLIDTNGIAGGSSDYSGTTENAIKIVELKSRECRRQRLERRLENVICFMTVNFHIYVTWIFKSVVRVHYVKREGMKTRAGVDTFFWYMHFYRGAR